MHIRHCVFLADCPIRQLWTPSSRLVGRGIYWNAAGLRGCWLGESDFRVGGREGTGSWSCEVIDIIERGSDAGNDERGTKVANYLHIFRAGVNNTLQVSVHSKEMICDCKIAAINTSHLV